MEFQVLGPIEARHQGSSVALGSFKQRALLALLLVHANEVVSTDRILDELWGEDAGDRQNALWVHVSNLRTALEPGRPKRSPSSVLVTQAPGYRLAVEGDDLDAWRFEQLVREGRGLLDTDPAAASLVVSEALALWRGRAYQDVAYEAFAQAEIARLEELRLEAVELRIDADLRLGRAGETVAELEALVRQHPLREGFTAQLMLALHRSGRQPEALRAYTRFRAELAEELGLEPSASIRDLEQRILLDDPALGRSHGASGRGGRLAVRGYELRGELGDGSSGPTYRAYQPAVGREVALTIVRSDLADDPGFIRRFEADAERVARLEHPHIVPLYDYWREPGAAYLVTRLLRGGSVADAIASGPVDPSRVARWARDLGAALAVSHRHEVAHGGITPSNLLLDEEDRAYLSDFGLAGERSRTSSLHAAPEQRAGGAPTPASDIYSLASVLGAALGAPSASPTVAAVLARATAADPAQRHPDAITFVEDLLGALGDAPAAGGGLRAAVADNPYKGLRAFGEADATEFFGRERVVERLVARLGESGSRSRFVALVGPSGSGKSSIVRAGLVPALRRGAVAGSAEWYVLDLTPGASPFEMLAAALPRLAVEIPAGLVARLEADANGIARTVRHLLGDEQAQLVLVIDQLEELFTMTPPATATAFLDALTVAVTDPRSRIRVVTTLRADFYDRPLRHHGIGELLRRGTEVLAPMSPAELERAIVEPAERAGVRFESGLVPAIVADMAEHPAALPLLQYALTELYDRRRGPTIERSAYTELGGIAGALVQRAERLYHELDAAGQRTMQQVLLRLVTLGDADEVSRRRARRQELDELGEAGTEPVLERLGRHRLLAFDRDPVTRSPTVEVAHEALLVEWDRLRHWIEAAREDLRHQRRLAADAAEWRRSGEDPDFLLHGSRLGQLASWAAGTDLTLGHGERAFLEASLARRDEVALADERRRLREAELRRRTRQRSRQLIGAGLVLALLAGLTAFGFVQRRQAEDLAGQLAAADEARRLAGASMTLSYSSPNIAMFLALLSLDASADAGLPTLAESEEALHLAIQGARIPYPVRDGPIEARIGPRGLTGIYRLPVTDLTAIAHDHLRAHRLAQHDCDPFGVDCRDTTATLETLRTASTRADTPASAFPGVSGTTVTIAGVGEISPGLRAELDRFEVTTRIQVQYRNLPEIDLAGLFQRGAPPDVLLLDPRSLQRLAEAGSLIDVGAYLDVAELRSQIGDHLVDLTSRDAGYYGVPIRLEDKGLVWYPSSAFADAGYEVPGTLAELEALTARIVADGRTPWCLGLESGAASGWPGTDWVEALVLRSGGTSLYDRWLRHEVRFVDPPIRAAFERFGAIALADGHVEGGGAAAAARPFWAATEQMFGDVATQLPGTAPRCWLNHANFGVQFETNGEFRPGIDADYFLLPSADPGIDPPMLGQAAFAGVLTDRPEVRALVRTIVAPRWGAVWAGQPGETFLSAHPGFDASQCAVADGDRRVNEVRVRLCEQHGAAIAAGQWRFDASDAMPAAVGGVTASAHGTFLTGMVEYARHGDGALDQILAGIDASWPTLPG